MKKSICYDLIQFRMKLFDNLWDVEMMIIRGNRRLKSVGMMAGGAYAMGIGTGIALLSSLSGDSVAFLWEAAAMNFPVSVETVNVLMTGCLLFYVFVQDRTVLGIGTILCPLIQNVGIMTIGWLGISSGTTVFGDWFCGLLGLTILAVGCGMVVFAQMGPSAYLAAGQIISKKLQWNFGVTIMAMDTFCFVIACLLEKRIAIGPLIATVVNGPMIDVTIKILGKMCKWNNL